jgi:hypothetical protein
MKQEHFGQEKREFITAMLVLFALFLFQLLPPLPERSLDLTLEQIRSTVDLNVHHMLNATLDTTDLREWLQAWRLAWHVLLDPTLDTEQRVAQLAQLEPTALVRVLHHLFFVPSPRTILTQVVHLLLRVLHVLQEHMHLLDRLRPLNVFLANLVHSVRADHANFVQQIHFQLHLAPHPAQLVQLAPCPTSMQQLAFHLRTVTSQETLWHFV